MNHGGWLHLSYQDPIYSESSSLVSRRSGAQGGSICHLARCCCRRRRRSRRCGCGGLDLCRLIRLLPRFDSSAQESPVLNRQAICLHFAGDVSRAPQLNLVQTCHFSFYLSPHDYLTRKHVRLHMSVWPNGQAAICREAELSFYHSVNE